MRNPTFGYYGGESVIVLYVDNIDNFAVVNDGKGKDFVVSLNDLKFEDENNLSLGDSATLPTKRDKQEFFSRADSVQALLLNFLIGIHKRYDLSALIDEDRKITFYTDDNLVYTITLNVEKE